MTLEFPFLDLLGGAMGVLLTLLVFSSLFGDHFLVRLIFYGYIGIMAGFSVVIAFNSVIFPLLFQPILDDPAEGIMQVAIPLLLCGLLVFKVSTRFSWVGNLSLAFLVGAGLAALVGGAIRGTLMPQISAVISRLTLSVQVCQQRINFLALSKVS